MISIFESGGKQYLVSKGDKIQVEKLAADEGTNITFDKVLFTFSGSDVNFGKPYLAGVTVQGKA